MKSAAYRLAQTIAICVLAATPSGLLADEIYGNFGPGESYDANAGWALLNDEPNYAFSFTVQGAIPFRLDSIDIALAVPAFGTVVNAVDVLLMSDVGGVPGTVLESFSFLDAMPLEDHQLHPPLVALSVLHPNLEPGTLYWIEASVAHYAPASGVNASWQMNSIGDTGTIDYQAAGSSQWFINPGSGAPRGVFQVNGTPAPEPSALILAALGGLALLAWRWRR